MTTNQTIFIVDDDRVILKYLSTFFSKSGWRVESFMSSKEALERLKLKQPVLVITDLDMPGMDGIELIRNIKSNEKFENIALLVMTALNENHIRFQSFKAGAIHFVNKPINPYELEAAVKSILNQFSKITTDQPIVNTPQAVRKSAVETWINEAEKVVLDNLTSQEFSLDELSAALHYSRSAVQKRIKQFTNLSVSKFIRSIRLEKSLEYMLEEENSIATIAELVGFKSHSYYTRCFKDYYGTDPVKKRRELLRESVIH
ncbi:MAG: response regulator [Schleiferiaceae bacterium]|jgi:YesN/AraC family two-component response regulator|nr:response regulator [Schleiferiaceae bacterium]MDA8820274.1 response regulator [Schleiferiaceae bacterium]